MKRCKTVNNTLSCQGRLIVHLLSHAKDLLVAIPFEDENKQHAAEDQTQILDAVIVDIGSIVSDCETWEQLRTYLQEAGHQVSPEFDKKMSYFDQIAESFPPADSIMNQ